MQCGFAYFVTASNFRCPEVPACLLLMYLGNIGLGIPIAMPVCLDCLENSGAW